VLSARQLMSTAHVRDKDVLIVLEANTEVKESMVIYLPKYHEEEIDILESIIGHVAVYVWLFPVNRMGKHTDHIEHVVIA
jgi:hypothetical protein